MHLHTKHKTKHYKKTNNTKHFAGYNYCAENILWITSYERQVSVLATSTALE